LENLKNIKVSVIGAARSGIAAADLLESKGAVVFVSDMAKSEDMPDAIDSLKRIGIPCEFGGHTEKVFDCSILVISPGVPSNAKVVRDAQQRGIKVVSELELASWFFPGKIIAITGSNGKTTTTTLLGEIFKVANRNHFVAGNIGTAFSGFIKTSTEDTVAILEVSSFQLDHIEKFHPKISILLNITPDHMDRYEHSMEKYSASKAKVFHNQDKDDVLIYNFDDSVAKNIVRFAKCKLLPFSVLATVDGANLDRTTDDKKLIKLSNLTDSLVDVSQIGIKGIHNVYNSMAAALAAYSMGINAEIIRNVLKSFKGVEHRLEFVREVGGVEFINDSKATNVDSVWYAINAIDKPVILLLGGRDKGNDYTKLFQVVKSKVKAIIAIGESAEKIYTEFRPYTEVKKVASMQEAVSEAYEISTADEVVLLSPACASFDWFKNYEHRGKVFKELVAQL
jgi:UDP-N-acetylmuramoylalanine--D-glutamate ligase